MGSLACKPSSSCSDDVLRRTQEQLQQLDAALPLRTVTTGSARDEHLGAQVAAQGLLDACSGLPPSVRADLAWRVGDRSKLPSGSGRWALEREICPGYDAVAEGQRANAQRAQEDRQPVDVMGLCKLERFELVDRLRYTLSDDRLSNFVVYDQVVRRGGSPSIVRELVREFFVRTPFELDAELLAALPESPSAEHGVTGRIAAFTRAGGLSIVDRDSVRWISGDFAPPTWSADGRWLVVDFVERMPSILDKRSEVRSARRYSFGPQP